MKLSIVIIFLNLFLAARCQENVPIMVSPNDKSPGSIKHIRFGCGYNLEITNLEIIINLPSEKHIAEIKGILKYSGLPVNFEIYSANIENAMALVLKEKRIILYNPQMMSYIDNKSNSYWTSMSILAHEIGHHLAGHTLTRESSYQAELEADKFSGFVLYKMGATEAEASKAILVLGDEAGTKTHPSKSVRAQAIGFGWNEASQLRYVGAIPPPPDDLPKGHEIFYPDMLHDSDFIESHQHEVINPNFYVGIITEVHPDYNAGGIEIFVEQQLKVGDLGKEYKYSVAKINERQMFNLEWEPSGRMSQVERSWFYELLKPGRRIVFSCVSEGSGGHLWLTYLQAISMQK